ncbi:MAG TPA: hypothetical protein VK509_08060, partial [Polyangiales bacterium]|nr:hypothetical protein [Polyangiales bacterium]
LGGRLEGPRQEPAGLFRVSRHRPSNPWRAFASLLLVLAGAACAGEDEGGDDAARGSEGAGVNAAEIPAFNGCSADDYEDHSADDDERVIAIAQLGLTYTPKCMIVAAGQRVRWEGNLSAHPLAPGHPDDPLAGSAGNPIEPKASGSVAEFAFEAPGTFPYHCTLHAFGAGQGMAGVVHVR